MAVPMTYEAQVARTKWYGLATAGAVVVLMLPEFEGAEILMLFAFALLLACVAQFLFHGATAMSIRLDAARRPGFEAIVAGGLPLLLTVYSLQGADLDAMFSAFVARLSGWTLLGAVVWSAIGWASVGFFHKVHRVRGFLILIGALFLLSWLRLYGALPLPGGATGGTEMLFFLLWSGCAVGSSFARLRIMGK